MALEPPLWAAGPSGSEFSHTALLDRRLVDTLFETPGVAGINDLRVTQRGAGPNMSVDISAGVGIIPGTSVAYQGKYLCRSTAVENRAVASPPASGTRTDIVIARVLDSEASGTADEFTIEVLTGTTTLPSDSILLAQINVGSGSASVTNAMILDGRQNAGIRDFLLTGSQAFQDITSATHSAVPNTIAKRNSDARIEVANPTSGGHAVNRSWAQDYDYRRGGRTLIGYYNRDSADSGNAHTIWAQLPGWAQNFRMYEVHIFGPGANSVPDLVTANMRVNTGSFAGNESLWSRALWTRASGGDYQDLFESENGENFCRVGLVGQARVNTNFIIARTFGTHMWSVQGTSFARGGGSGATSRQGLAQFGGQVNVTDNITSFYFGLPSPAQWSTATRVAIYGVARPGFDNVLPGNPIADV